MSIEIVEATESHIPDIVELWKEFMDHHKDIDPRFPAREDAHVSFEQHIRELMGTEDTLVLVALDESRVVGFSISQVNSYPPIWVESDKHGFIDTMAITADYRRKGIGEHMLGRIFESFASHGIDRIELTVAARNEVGYSFWRKHGFKDFSHRLYLQRG
ncbi:MAG: GNAT family N-acetyltransferase [Dehalococcoidales bacterium]|nr:MAG: GNAT family N-acetyltransferase [Dehalococcoidales bacterium]